MFGGRSYYASNEAFDEYLKRVGSKNAEVQVIHSVSTSSRSIAVVYYLEIHLHISERCQQTRPKEIQEYGYHRDSEYSV
jgi:hypothetical protein